MTTPSGFERLPEEVLRPIIRLVYEAHSPTLASLMRVNRTCRFIATAQGLRHVRFQLASAHRTRQEVNLFLDASRRCDGLREVRWLKVQGYFNIREVNKGPQQWSHAVTNGATKAESEAQDLRWSIRNHMDYDETTTSLTGGGWECEPRYRSYEDTVSGNEAWQPIVDLLAAVVRLEDFVWATSVRLPPIVLEALQRHQPGCRFHLPDYTTSFTAQYLTEIEPHEMAMLSSPQLSSIGANWLSQTAPGLDAYRRDVVLALVDGIAPNLKRVRLTRGRPLISFPGASDDLARPRLPWPGFGPGVWDSNKRPGGKGRLEYLCLQTPRLIQLAELQTWHRLTSFDSLVELRMSNAFQENAMEWAADNDVFPALKRLSMYIGIDGLLGAAGTFLSSLRPLEEIQLLDRVSSDLLCDATKKHGSTLRRLSLPAGRLYIATRNTMTLDQLHCIRDNCPVLEDLTATVKRTRSSEDEMSVYKVIGSMKSVVKLALSLNCYAPKILPIEGNRGLQGMYGEYTDAWLEEPFAAAGTIPLSSIPGDFIRNGDICRHLINYAFDEELARSIWNAISVNKLGRPLRSLEVTSTEGVNLGIDSSRTGALEVFKHFHRTYVMEGSVRDDMQGGIERCSEPGRAKREELERDSTTYTDSEEPGTIMHVFRKVWPKGEWDDWRQDWKSLPLQVGGAFKRVPADAAISSERIGQE